MHFHDNLMFIMPYFYAAGNGTFFLKI